MTRSFFQSLPSPPARSLAFWIAVLGAVAALRVPRLGVPLLDHHAFRQTQTAMTAEWLPRDFTLPAYPLPVFGPPWSAPFEFPTFQFVLAGVHALGLPLDLAGRLCGLLSFVAALALMLHLFQKAGASWSARLYFLGFAGLSPYALVWSRACMIEFTAVALALAWLALLFRIARKGWCWRTAASALAVGSLAAATKITTIPVCWTAGALLAADTLLVSRSRAAPRVAAKHAAGWSMLLLVPMLVAVWWTRLTDQVKLRSPATQFLTSQGLTEWNFGTWAQRFDPRTWETIAQRLAHLVLPWVWPLALIGLAALPCQPRWARLLTAGLVLGSAGVVVSFFNLYVVHDYYLCAIVVPLWWIAALGLDRLAAWIPSRRYRIALVAAAFTAVAVTSARSGYVRGSYHRSPANDVLVIARAVDACTSPDDELLVMGDDWNPRILYYSHRRGLMVTDDPASDRYASDYAATRQVRYAVSSKAEIPRLEALWPRARATARTATFTLFSIR